MQQCVGKLARLLKSDVRRQWRHIRIRDCVDHTRPLGRQGFVPDSRKIFCAIDANALKTKGFCLRSVRKIRQVLRNGILGVTIDYPLFPRDLIEIIIVQDQHYQLRVAPFHSSIWQS
jgi:hypothetical protein